MTQTNMQRREFVGDVTTLVLTAGASALLAGSARADANATPAAAAHHHMAADPQAQSLAATSANCVSKAEACLQHCIDRLSAGDTSFAGCAKSVREMIVFCRALNEAAVQGSSHLKALAKITLDVCQACETECRKHKEHDVCKACSDACAECAKQCKAVSA